MELNPIRIYERGVKAIPSIRYAMGLTGLISMAMISIIVGKSAQSAILSVVYVLAGMYLLLIFAGVAKEPSAGRGPAIFVLWAVTILFVSTLVMTVSAYAFGMPHGWAQLVGAPPILNNMAGGAHLSSWLEIPVNNYSTYTAPTISHVYSAPTYTTPTYTAPTYKEPTNREPTYTAPTISSYNYTTGTTLPTGSEARSFPAGTGVNSFRTSRENEAISRSAQAAGVLGECVVVGMSCGPDSLRGVCIRQGDGGDVELNCSFQHLSMKN